MPPLCFPADSLETAGDVVGLHSFLGFPDKLREAVLGTELLGVPALAYSAWHPIGALSADR